MKKHYTISVMKDGNYITFAKADNYLSVTKFVKSALTENPVVKVDINGKIYEMFIQGFNEDGTRDAKVWHKIA